jgi:hypothetical protein
MAVFWTVAPCSLVTFIDVSEVLAASIIRAMRMMEAAKFYHTTRSYNPEDSYLHTRRRENLKSYTIC